MARFAPKRYICADMAHVCEGRMGVPSSVRMLWHALSGGWGAWMPSGAMIRDIGALFDLITCRP
jgi:hypothetical protein